MSAADCELGELRFMDSEMRGAGLGTCYTADEKCNEELQRIARWQKEKSLPVLATDLPTPGKVE